MKILLLLERSHCTLCLSVSRLTSLLCPVFIFNRLSLFPFSLLPVFALRLLCGLTSKRIGGLGVLGLQTFGEQQPDVMGESYRLI